MVGLCCVSLLIPRPGAPKPPMTTTIVDLAAAGKKQRYTGVTPYLPWFGGSITEDEHHGFKYIG